MVDFGRDCLERSQTPFAIQPQPNLTSQLKWRITHGHRRIAKDTRGDFFQRAWALTIPKHQGAECVEVVPSGDAFIRITNVIQKVCVVIETESAISRISGVTELSREILCALEQHRGRLDTFDTL